MLAINPEECIDCAVCEPECPVNAIVADTAIDPEESARWEEINRKYSLLWPNITEKKDPLPDAADWEGVPNKFEEHFSELPGEGD